MPGGGDAGGGKKIINFQTETLNTDRESITDKSLLHVDCKLSHSNASEYFAIRFAIS